MKEVKVFSLLFWCLRQRDRDTNVERKLEMLGKVVRNVAVYETRSRAILFPGRKEKHYFLKLDYSYACSINTQTIN